MHRFWNHLIRPAFEALKPSSIVEVGAAEGLNTLFLAEYATQNNATFIAIDPFPRFDASALRRRFGGDITLIRKKSLEVIPTLKRPDVVLIDGDHNWYTVHEELHALLKLSESPERFPVVFLHDTGWPYGKRDMYFFPADIPSDAMQPHAVGGVSLESSLLVPAGGVNARMHHALQEGGGKNGVRTAVEDFLRETKGVGVTFLDGFHGIGILYPEILLKQNPDFAVFLSSLVAPPVTQNHIAALEQDRLSQFSRVQELRRSLQHEHSIRLQSRERIHQLHHTIEQFKGEMQRIFHTRSWRMMAPMRKADILAHKLLSIHAWKRLFASLWRTIRSAPPPQAKPEEDRRRASAHVAALYGHAPSVSVIVAARNNGAFLRECLQSILSQSIPPYEVIYCDDGSTDNSVEIARSIPGVKILTQKQGGVAKARNAAVAQSTGSLLLHVDGDDMLSPHYIATQLAGLASASDAVFAYGYYQYFGADTGQSQKVPWNLERLWKKNYINTSSIIRRSAFEAVGGWHDDVGTLWDWGLWLRLSRIGRGVQTDAMLLYRRHVSNWSGAIGRHMDDDDAGRLMGRLRRAVARVSVCCIFGGRLPELLPLWMDSLASSIRAHVDSSNAPELIVLDNSGRHMDEIRERALATGVFSSVLVVPYPEKLTWTSEMQRRHKVCMFLAKAYNRLLALASGEVIWFLEDDVVVPEHTYDTLFRGLTDGLDPPAAVSGLYRNRHQEDWIAHMVDSRGRVLPVDTSLGKPLQIDLAGTGCLMAMRPFVPYQFTSHWRGHAPAHDWTWSESIRRDGKKIILHPNVHCRHYMDASSFR